MTHSRVSFGDQLEKQVGLQRARSEGSTGPPYPSLLQLVVLHSACPKNHSQTPFVSAFEMIVVIRTFRKVENVQGSDTERFRFFAELDGDRPTKRVKNWRYPSPAYR